jgi:S1-C subfamily serine protease
MAGQPADDRAATSPGAAGEPVAVHSASAIASLPGAGLLPGQRPGPAADEAAGSGEVPAVAGESAGTGGDAGGSAEPAPDGREGISEFGQFGWFADSSRQAERDRSAWPRRHAGRGGSGALLPGDWAKAVQPPGTGRADAGLAGHAVGSGDGGAVRRGRWGRLRGRGPASDRSGGGEPDSGEPGSAGPGGGRPVRRSGNLSGGRLALAAGGLALACTVLGGVIGGYIALHTHDGPAAQVNPSYSLGAVPPALTNRPASSVAGIAARVTPSVVMIKVDGGEGTGSGFLIRGGYIVTDNHVVTLDGAVTHASLEVYFSNGKSASGVLVGRDPYSDIAILKVAGDAGLPALTMGNSASVEVGDPVLAIGSPLGLADTVTSGIVSAVDRPVQPGAAMANTPQVYFDAIQTDAPINPGNSGGPLVNSRGQVIGVDAAIDTLGQNALTGTQGGSIGLGFAIPANQARRVAEQLIRTGRASHAVIGADINATWSGNGAQIVPARSGRTATVTPGGPAARAGLLPGDVIVKFGSQPVTNASTLLDAVRSMPPGARARVTFIRDGQAHTVSLRLGSAES